MNKVLFIVTEDWYFRSHRLSLAKDAIKKGYEVALLSNLSEFQNQISNEGIKTYNWRINRRSINPILELRSLYDVLITIKSFNPDLIHAVAFKPIIYSHFAGRLLGIKKFIFALGGLGTIFSVKKTINSVIKIILIPLLKIAFKGKSVRLVLQNQDDINILLKSKVVNEQKIRLIKGAGVDTNIFCPAKNPPKIPSVLFAGRLLWTKGVGDFVECAKRIKRKVNASFLVAGKPDSLNPESVNEKFLIKWEKKGVIDWLGYKDDMVSVIQSCSLICFPSTYGEGLPKILIESASCGIPLLAYDIAGPREIIKDNINGYLVAPGDIERLEHLLMLLIKNSSKRKSMGKNGREYVINHFSQEIISEQTLDLWKQVLQL